MAEDATRFVFEFDGHFLKDPDIDEYDLIPFVGEMEKQDMYVENHKLAINALTIPTQYTFAYKLILKFPRPTNKDTVVVDGKNLNTLSYSRAVLLINPETVTAWNIRKELVVAKVLCRIEDLKLSNLILTKHPKSPETWIHRRWLLKQLYLQRPSQQVDSSVITEEFTVCTRAAEKYPSNYSAWSHRLWVINHLVDQSTVKVLQNELIGNETWMTKHISDHSGLHYRGILLENHLKTDHPDWPGILLRELQLVMELITSYPDHEALWYYRRQIMHLLLTNCGRIDKSVLKAWAVLDELVTNVKQAINMDTRLLFSERCHKNTFLDIGIEKMSEEIPVNSSNDGLKDIQSRQEKTFKCNKKIFGGNSNYCRSSKPPKQILSEAEEQFLKKFECDKIKKNQLYLKYKKWFMNTLEL